MTGRGAGAAAAARPWAWLWWALAAAALGVALASSSWWPGAATALDWQRQRVWSQPWRMWTAALVHLDTLHLWANVLGCAVLAFVGRAARVSVRAVCACFLAWPVTHLALLASADLQRYAGLSGVLHAGVAVLAVELVATRRGRDRGIGLALAVGLALKLVLERAWAAPVSTDGAWSFPVATVAHLAGALAGGACAVATVLWAARATADPATLSSRSSLAERRQP